MKLSRFRVLFSLALVTASVLVVQNILLQEIVSEGAENGVSDRETGTRISQTLLSPLHPRRRDLEENVTFPPSKTTAAHYRAHRLHTNLTGRRIATGFHSNSTDKITDIYTNSTDEHRLTTVSTHKSSDAKSETVAHYHDNIRLEIEKRNRLSAQALKKSRRPELDYSHWEDLWKSDNDMAYPFYGQDSEAKSAPVPPEIAALFPTQFSNTTELSLPPPQHFAFKRFRDVFKNMKIDIFELLSRWGNLSLPFYSDVDRLRIEVKDPPVPRLCTLTPGPRLRQKLESYHWRKHAECFQKVRDLTPFELDGNHILFTVRTSVENHSERLPLLFHTWLANVNRSNVAIITDGLDPVLQYRAAEAGLKYLISVGGYDKLCDKAGDEISLMFLQDNSRYEWFCHVDDDIYVNLDRLVDVLANFGRDEPVYFGRAGTKPGEPRRILSEAKLGVPGSPYHFAVGGMYCLSRTLLNKARRWIGGREAFRRMCNVTKEPEDVTVGFVVGVLLGLELNQTGLIHSHGNDLYGVNPASLKFQIGVSYGFGSVHWGYRPNNVVVVPQRLFTLEEDPSQFLSLHCHYHRTVGWCLHRFLARRRRPH